MKIQVNSSEVQKPIWERRRIWIDIRMWFFFILGAIIGIYFSLSIFIDLDLLPKLISFNHWFRWASSLFFPAVYFTIYAILILFLKKCLKKEVSVYDSDLFSDIVAYYFGGGISALLVKTAYYVIKFVLFFINIINEFLNNYLINFKFYQS